MIKRLLRILFQVFFSPITIMLYIFSLFGIIIDFIISPIEYTITGKTFIDYFPSKRIWSKPFLWFIFLLDNVSYYIYCKICNEKYEHDYWLTNF